MPLNCVFGVNQINYVFMFELCPGCRGDGWRGESVARTDGEPSQQQYGVRTKNDLLSGCSSDSPHLWHIVCCLVYVSTSQFYNILFSLYQQTSQCYDVLLKMRNLRNVCPSNAMLDH